MKKKFALFLLGIGSLMAVSMYAADNTPAQSDQPVCQTPYTELPCNNDTVCTPVPCNQVICNTDTVCNPAPCNPTPVTCPGGC